MPPGEDLSSVLGAYAHVVPFSLEIFIPRIAMDGFFSMKIWKVQLSHAGS